MPKVLGSLRNVFAFEKGTHLFLIKTDYEFANNKQIMMINERFFSKLFIFKACRCAEAPFQQPSHL